ncbi:hypothetical protein [Lactiplantibacillus plantarum]|uniref:hypothetical protein n=1 Tax=Lactiplantibacillus plantarum TaxID=1590 RepID=UPI000CDD1A30|nr:hypothetical protein [Lactiplantibacillus plantarum]
MAVVNDRKSLKQVITASEHNDLRDIMSNLLPNTMGHDTISRRKGINRAVTSLRKATILFDTQK